MKECGKISVEEFRMTYYEETLRKTYEYGGFRFWENYILSNIVRNLAEDIRVLGNKSVIDGYVCLFGEQVEDLMEFLVTQDIGLLRECSEVTDGLLFEDYLEPNLRRYALKNLAEQNTTNLFGEFGTPMLDKNPLGRYNAHRGMLAAAWDKLKSIGKNLFAPLVPYLQQGLAWTKGIARQGLAWFNATPWAKMLLPVLLITGSVNIARKLLNRVRRKKLSKQESAALQQYAMQNNSKINTMRRKAGLRPITV